MLKILTMQDIQSICPPAYSFLQQNDLAALASGRHDLENGIFVNVFSYETKDRAHCSYEAHLAYADLFYIVRGSETVFVRGLEGMTVSKPYDEKFDVVYYDDPKGEEDEYRLDAGSGLLLLPEHGHMPSVATDPADPTVKKMVFKIPVALL